MEGATRAEVNGSRSWVTAGRRLDAGDSVYMQYSLEMFDIGLHKNFKSCTNNVHLSPGTGIGGLFSWIWSHFYIFILNISFFL